MALLQARNECRIISGGYAGEAHGFVDAGYSVWTDVDTNGTSNITYYYHDSNQPSDANSTRVYVRVKDTWSNYVRNSDNSITFTVTTSVSHIHTERIGFPNSTPGRCIYFGPNTSIRSWGVACHATNWVGTILNSDVNVQTRTITLAPQTESTSTGLYYHNYVDGYASNPAEMYHDEFWIGTFFRNPLPIRLPAPTYTERLAGDICTYSAYVSWDFSSAMPVNTGNHTWVLTISEHSDFSLPLTYSVITNNPNFSFTDVKVKPSTHYYWKLDLVDNVYTADTASGEFDSPLVIKPSEVVPPFGENDCEKISANIPVAEWPNWENGE